MDKIINIRKNSTELSDGDRKVLFLYANHYPKNITLKYDYVESDTIINSSTKIYEREASIS